MPIGCGMQRRRGRILLAMSVTQWQLPGADGQPLYGNTHLPDDGAGQARGVLLICHGFKGYKDYGFLPALAHAAAERGLVAHRFNFSHSGVTERHETFERPELFERDTFAKQVHDVHAVASAVARGELAGPGLGQVWFGHSRGGVTVMLAAGGGLVEPGRRVAGQPRALITAAAPSRACHFDEAACDELRRAGRVPSPSARTGQVLYVGRSWLAEIEAQPDAHDVPAAVRRATLPMLVVHGGGDETVPVSAAHELAAATGERGRLMIIDAASHTFDAPNPLALDGPLPAATSRLINEACAFALHCFGET